MRTRPLSLSEIRAHQIIQRTLADTQFWISTNVSVQAVIEKEYIDGWIPSAYFSLYTRGAFDFVVYGADYEPAFAVEIDGIQHDDERHSHRDLIKNWLCAQAGLPLLRLRADALQEDDETSVLAWLVAAYVASERQVDADMSEAETEWIDIQGNPIPPDALPAELRDDDRELTDDELKDLIALAGNAGEANLSTFGLDDLDAQRAGIESDVVIGEPGIEMEHEFPDNALVRTRLLERWRIAQGQVEPLIVFGERARYVVELRSPSPLQPPRFRLGAASDYIVSELNFRVVKIAEPAKSLLSGAGKGELAWANKLPTLPGAPPRLAPIDLPWDAWGVARQLAEFNALRQVETWARRTLASA